MADRFDLINLAKSMTTTLGGTGTANVNIDSNTLFVDGVNNRVGVGTNAPTAALQVAGDIVSSGTIVPASSYLRNRIINGDMRIDQRNNGSSVTVNNGSLNAFCVDRWEGAGETTDGVYTLQRQSGGPTGFVNFLRAAVTTADASIGASQRYSIIQRIEGFNVADFGWGAAGASAVTLSFWVRSSLTGTFGGSVRNSAGNRSYPFTYVINAANTWEFKSVTIPGDTTGTWLTDNGIGFWFNFDLGSGSTLRGTAGAWSASDFRGATGAVSLISTLSATLDLTGVQVEAGSVATPFERRHFTHELMLCQRYFCKNSNPDVVATNGASYLATGMFSSGGAFAYNSIAAYVGFIEFPVAMRVAPQTFTFINTNLPSPSTAGQWSIFNGSTWLNAGVTAQSVTAQGFGVTLSGGWSVSGAFPLYYAWTANAEF